jgi:hypothetical protein
MQYRLADKLKTVVTKPGGRITMYDQKAALLINPIPPRSSIILEGVTIPTTNVYHRTNLFVQKGMRSRNVRVISATRLLAQCFCL